MNNEIVIENDNYEQTIMSSLTATSACVHLVIKKVECNLNQSKDNSFVERVAKNNS